jgi:hypothetical protein
MNPTVVLSIPEYLAVSLAILALLCAANSAVSIVCFLMEKRLERQREKQQDEHREKVEAAMLQAIREGKAHVHASESLTAAMQAEVVRGFGQRAN